LIIAGLIAAIMSSVDSALNSASTLLIVDFVQPRRPNLTPLQLARLGRYTTLGLMLLAALWAPQIDHFPGIFAYLQQAFAYVTPPLVAVFALGMLWPSLGAGAALRALVCGHLLSAGWFVASQLGWLDVHYSIVAGLLFFATLIFAGAWQAICREPVPEDAALRFAGMPRTSPRVRVGVYVLTALTALMVWVFR